MSNVSSSVAICERSAGAGEINACDAAIGSARGPAGAAAIGDNEVFLVPFGFTDEFAFEGFETLPIGR